MRILPSVLLAILLAACGTGPAGPTVWAVNDLNDALLRNVASVSEAVAGQWVPAGASCDGLVLDMDLADARPEIIPDVAGWFAALSGATLTLAPVQPTTDEQAYTLTTGLGEQMVIRDLATDGIAWRMPDRGELRIYPSYLRLDGAALSLMIDADTVSVQVGGAPAITFERCG